MLEKAMMENMKNQAGKKKKKEGNKPDGIKHIHPWLTVLSAQHRYGARTCWHGNNYLVRVLPLPVAKLDTRKPERCGDGGCWPLL